MAYISVYASLGERIFIAWGSYPADGQRKSVATLALESQQLCRDLFHGCDLVSWQGRDVIVDMRLVDERGLEHLVVHDAVAQQLVVQ